MRIAICDDLNYDKHLLFNYITGYCQTNYIQATVTKYDSGESLLKNFKKDSFQIIFLDIYMHGLSGVETAERIRTIDSDCLLVFVTSSSEHALDGFAVNALHYLVKPITPGKINEVFTRCKNLLNAEQQFIEVMSDRLLVKILIKSIQFIEVYDKACFIHKDSDVIKTYLPLEDIAKQLDEKTFLRCHRSYVINMRAIENIDDNDFILKSGDRIPIRQSEKQAIKQTYMNYLFALARGDCHV